jgi:L-alanine-DL-glutamate epimerase-like enolase superfamily enzyme
MPWTVKLFEEVPVPVKGELVVPTQPGLGLKFDNNSLKRFGVA